MVPLKITKPPGRAQGFEANIRGGQTRAQHRLFPMTLHCERSGYKTVDIFCLSITAPMKFEPLSTMKCVKSRRAAR